MRAPFSTAVAIVTGLLVLLGFFFTADPLVQMRVTMLRWALLLAAFALLVGVWNLLQVHWMKVKTQQLGAPYSAVVIVSFIATFVVAIVFGGPTAFWTGWIFDHIQQPIESSLFALLAVVLVIAVIRFIRRRPNALSIVFVLSVLLVLFGTILPQFNFIREWFMEVPVLAGARGILLGIALGVVATGLRILTGTDRPYSG